MGQKGKQAFELADHKCACGSCGDTVQKRWCIPKANQKYQREVYETVRDHSIPEMNAKLHHHRVVE